MSTNNRLFKIDLSMYKNGISKNMIIRFYKQIIYVICIYMYICYTTWDIMPKFNTRKL